MGEMRYIIIGAGAVGGTIGGRLFQSGHEVALPVAAAGQAGELDLRDGDVLVLAVKTQDAEAVLAEWPWRPVRGDRVRIQPVNGSPRGGGSSWQSLTRGTGPDPGYRVDRGRLPQRGNRAARPEARCARAGERGAAAAGQPGRPGAQGAGEYDPQRGYGPHRRLTIVSRPAEDGGGPAEFRRAGGGRRWTAWRGRSR